MTRSKSNVSMKEERDSDDESIPNDEDDSESEYHLARDRE
jgi:hypothetical protein